MASGKASPRDFVDTASSDSENIRGGRQLTASGWRVSEFVSRIEDIRAAFEYIVSEFEKEKVVVSDDVVRMRRAKATTMLRDGVKLLSDGIALLSSSSSDGNSLADEAHLYKDDMKRIDDVVEKTKPVVESHAGDERHRTSVSTAALRSDESCRMDSSVPASNRQQELGRQPGIVAVQTIAGIASSFRTMFDRQQATDVKFQLADGGLVSAHRCILVAHSAVFEAMFSIGMSGSNADSNDVIRIMDIEETTFHQLLTWIYDGETDVSYHDALPLLYAARKYRLTSLVERCEAIVAGLGPGSRLGHGHHGHQCNDMDEWGNVLAQNSPAKMLGWGEVRDVVTAEVVTNSSTVMTGTQTTRHDVHKSRNHNATGAVLTEEAEFEIVVKRSLEPKDTASTSKPSHAKLPADLVERLRVFEQLNRQEEQWLRSMADMFGSHPLIKQFLVLITSLENRNWKYESWLLMATQSVVKFAVVRGFTDYLVQCIARLGLSPRICNDCSSRGKPKVSCPNGLCDLIAKDIEKHLPEPKAEIVWKKAHYQAWSMSAWNIAHLFQPPSSYTLEPDETDLEALLTMMRKCSIFRKMRVRRSLTGEELDIPSSTCKQVSDIRNFVFHSQPNYVTHRKLLNDHETMSNFVSECIAPVIDEMDEVADVVLFLQEMKMLIHDSVLPTEPADVVDIGVDVTRTGDMSVESVKRQCTGSFWNGFCRSANSLLETFHLTAPRVRDDDIAENGIDENKQPAA